MFCICEKYENFFVYYNIFHDIMMLFGKLSNIWIRSCQSICSKNCYVICKVEYLWKTEEISILILFIVFVIEIVTLFVSWVFVENRRNICIHTIHSIYINNCNIICKVEYLWKTGATSVLHSPKAAFQRSTQPSIPAYSFFILDQSHHQRKIVSSILTNFIICQRHKNI